MVNLRNSKTLVSSSWAAICIFVVSVQFLPTTTSSAPPKTVPIAECEVNGFGLGDSQNLMRRLFGEPEPNSVVKSPLNEYPHREYLYEGMRIVFSTHGHSAFSYYVSAPEYRLRSGIGVGSMWMEIVEALGPGSLSSSGGSIFYSYHVVDSEGDYVPAWLRFAVENDVVTSFSVVTTR